MTDAICVLPHRHEPESGVVRGTMNGAARSANSERPLTRSLDHAEEGLAMKATRIACRPWDGPLNLYQDQAAKAIYAETNRHPGVITWITPTCSTENCLAPDHMAINAPRFIDYPPGLCVYCGAGAGTRDHLMPRAWSGEAARKYVAVVPACRECNSAIGDRIGPCITERRAAAKRHIERKYKSTLRAVDYTPAEMREFGPDLRKFIKRSLQDKAIVKQRLAWPIDPVYDLRAFERSGIDDPYYLGLVA